MMTNEQRQLAEDSLPLAYYMANKLQYLYPLSYQDIVDICIDSLCADAVNFNPETGKKFSTYTCYNMRFRVANKVSRRRSVSTVPLEGVFMEPSAGISHIEETISREQVLSHVMRNFHGTAREKTAAIWFIRDPGKRQQDIADIVGIGQKTVCTAIKKLQKQLLIELAG